MGTPIRHACLRPALPVGALPVPMIVPSFFALLIPAIGAASLTEAGLSAAGAAAIAMSAVTTAAEKKDREAFVACASPPHENHFAKSRHAYLQARLDNSNGSVAG